MESEVYSDTVCNIDYILKIRLVAGFYNYLKTSAKKRLLIKMYCACLTIFVIYILIVNMPMSAGILTNIFILLFTAEIVIYCLVSLYYEDEYILRFYSVIPIIDGLPNAKRIYKLMNKSLWFLLALTTFLRCLMHVILCYFDDRFCIFDGDVLKMLVIVSLITMDLARFSMVVIFILFYCRVTVILDTLTTKGFNNSEPEQLSPEKYVEMIEALLNAVKDTDDPLQKLIFTTAFCCTPWIVRRTYQIINRMMTDVFDLIDILRLINLHHPWFILLVTTVLSDLTADALDEILSVTIEKLTACRDERQRSEVLKLISVLQCTSPDYTLWRVVPLSTKFLLQSYSFCLTAVIAIAQIKK